MKQVRNKSAVSPASKSPSWGGGAKLTWRAVKRLRARKKFTRTDASVVAERMGLDKETIWRAYIGRSWTTVRFQRLPPEYKQCVVCRKRFERRFPNGRHRSDTFWNQKLTCNASCFAHYNWQRGVYANR